MENGIKKISDSIQETIISPELVDLGKEITELSIDSLMNNGLLKDIPIVGTLTAIGKTALNIRDALFLKKLFSFLFQLADVPIADRKKMIADVEESKTFRTKVGEKLLHIIDHTEDSQSAEVVGMLFSSFLRGELTYRQFLKASQIINKIFIEDLVKFVNDEKEYNFDTTKIDTAVLNSGLYDIEIDPVEVDVKDEGRGMKMTPKQQVFDTDVSGGTMSASLSNIGKVIKKVLSDRI